MTISFPTSTTIQVRLERGNRINIEGCILSYSCGDWIIADDVDINQFTEIEIWDEETSSVYTTDICGVVRVRTDRDGHGRHIITFNSNNIVRTSMDFSSIEFTPADNDGVPASF